MLKVKKIFKVLNNYWLSPKNYEGLYILTYVMWS